MVPRRAAGRLSGGGGGIFDAASTPRRRAEILHRNDGAAVLDARATIVDDRGDDVTALFVAGARHALAVAEAHGCRYALLADGSPSCGSSVIHDGTFAGVTHPGAGVIATWLRRHGIAVFAPAQIAEPARRIAGDDA